MLFDQLIRLMGWIGEFFLVLFLLALLALGAVLLTSPLRDLGVFVVVGMFLVFRRRIAEQTVVQPTGKKSCADIRQGAMNAVTGSNHITGG